MYAKPFLLPLDLDAPRALCCEIAYKDNVILRTPLCSVPFCSIVTPCSVPIGPVTISG